LEAKCIAVAKARGTLVLEAYSVARVNIDAHNNTEFIMITYLTFRLQHMQEQLGRHITNALKTHLLCSNINNHHVILTLVYLFINRVK
jgi:hypothetical protein